MLDDFVVSLELDDLDNLAVSISCVFLLFIHLYLGEVVLIGVCGLSGDGFNLSDGDQ